MAARPVSNGRINWNQPADCRLD